MLREPRDGYGTARGCDYRPRPQQSINAVLADPGRYRGRYGSTIFVCIE